MRIFIVLIVLQGISFNLLVSAIPYITEDQTNKAHNQKVLEKYDRILVFQYGKVGSSSLRDTLKSVRNDGIIQSHWFPILERVLNSDGKTLIINICRNVFDRNISNYFQNINNIGHLWYLDNKKNILDRTKYSIEDLVADFSSKNMKHIEERLITWYSNFNELLGINIFETPFDFEKKYTFFSGEKYDLLLIRNEDIKMWPNILESALGLKELVLKYSNFSPKKWYGNLQSEFTNIYIYDQKEIDVIMAIDFMNHFYTEMEIKKFLKKYS